MIALLSAATMARVPVWRTELSLARDALRNAPGSSRAWSDLGMALYTSGKPDEAAPALERALALDPDNPWALEYAGLIDMDRGRLAEAEARLTRALALAGRNPKTANHLGEARLARGDAAGAERLFAYAARERPWIPAYHWNHALALERLGRCAEARERWLRYLAIETDPDDRTRVRGHLRAVHDTPGGACATGPGSAP